MAPTSRAVVVVALSLLYLCRTIFSSEYFSTLTLFNNELHKQGCSSLSEWEEYAADCGKEKSPLSLLLCHVLLRGPTVTGGGLASRLRANVKVLITTRSDSAGEMVG